MGAVTTPNDLPARASTRSPARTVLGLLLIAPALLLWLFALAAPTFQTITISLQDASPLRDARFVGGANYTRLFGERSFGEALRFTLALAGERVAIVALVPPLLALALNEFGRALRIPVRLLFTIPLALFAPVSGALVWRLVLAPQGGSPLSTPEGARGALLWADALATFGLACGVGLVVYLIALRGAGAGAPRAERVRGPLLVGWFVTAAAAAALAVQSYTPSAVLTGGGPAGATATLTLLQFQYGFQNFRFGPAAAVATLVLAAPLLLGLVAGLVVVATGLRLETVPGGKPVGLLPRAGKPLAVAGLVLLLLGSLVVVGAGLAPTLGAGLTSLKTRAEAARDAAPLLPADPSPEAYARVAEGLPLGRLAFNTIAPVVAGVCFVQLPIAYLAALGIGALRPLGRRSEWLLLPFSPWLFVTVGPLSIAAYRRLSEAGQLNTTLALIPPLLLNVPLLFILTLFFKGQEAKWRAARAEGRAAGGAFFRLVILPSLPLALLLASIATLLGMQEFLWPLLVANRPEYWTIPVALASLPGRFDLDWPALAAALTLFGLPVFLWFFPLFGLFQSFYLDRLALATGTDGA